MLGEDASLFEPHQFLERPSGITIIRPTQIASDAGTLVVGAGERTLSNLTLEDRAFIYRFEGEEWVLEEEFGDGLEDGAAELLGFASRFDGFGSFGQSVAINGNTTVISARHQWTFVETILPSGEVVQEPEFLNGGIFIYLRGEDGVWGEGIEVRPANFLNQDYGDSIALNGDTLAASNLSSSTGSTVTLFERVAGEWIEIQTLTLDASSLFGSARTRSRLAFAGPDTLAVGVPGGGDDNGRVDVFSRGTDGVWSFQESLEIPSEISTQFRDFGEVVSGSPGLVVASDVDGSLVVVFEQMPDGSWEDGVRILPEIFDAGDEFGSSLAISNSCVLVGAPREQSVGVLNNRNAEDNSFVFGSGAVYLFEQDAGGDWIQQQFLKNALNDEIGMAVAADPVTGSIFMGGNNTVFVQRSVAERDILELELTVFAPDENSPLFGPVIFDLEQSLPVLLELFLVESTATTMTLRSPFVDEFERRGFFVNRELNGILAEREIFSPGQVLGDFEEGECSCVRVRDIFGNLPNIVGITILENTLIPDLTPENISFESNEFTINPAGLEFVSGILTIGFELAPAVAPPEITSIEKFVDTVRLEFRGEPGRTDWQFTGGANLTEFTDEGIVVQELIEFSSGNYRVDIQVPAAPERFFLRVELTD